jgi:hypothetical protein
MNYKILFSLLFSYIIFISNCNFLNVDASYNDSFWYEPEDITYKDNAYNYTEYISLQWWYIDVVCVNNYSIHIGILSIGAKGLIGFYIFQINLYNNGKFIKRNVQIIPVKSIYSPIDKPIIMYEGKKIFEEYTDEKNKKLLDINMEINDLKVELNFSGLMKGWKGYTGLGMWGCPFPKAKVIGNITINNDRIAVSGIGYQERGWDVRKLHKSWFWGKFGCNSSNIVFSKNMKNDFVEDLFILIINFGNDSYFSIHRENITLEYNDLIFDHGSIIPKKSSLIVKENGIFINVNLEIESVQFISLIFLKYWRFHIRVVGFITIDDYTEYVDDFQIMEILKFK